MRIKKGTPKKQTLREEISELFAENQTSAKDYRKERTSLTRLTANSEPKETDGETYTLPRKKGIAMFL